MKKEQASGFLFGSGSKSLSSKSDQEIDGMELMERRIKYYDFIKHGIQFFSL